jgi:hypothetical protein
MADLSGFRATASQRYDAFGDIPTLPQARGIPLFARHSQSGLTLRPAPKQPPEVNGVSPPEALGVNRAGGGASGSASPDLVPSGESATT